MFHLEHVNLVVDDIPAALHFYQAAFPYWRLRSSENGLKMPVMKLLMRVLKSLGGKMCTF